MLVCFCFFFCNIIVDLFTYAIIFANFYIIRNIDHLENCYRQLISLLMPIGQTKIPGKGTENSVKHLSRGGGGIVLRGESVETEVWRQKG